MWLIGMAEQHESFLESLMVREDQGLIDVVVGDNGSEATRNFTDAGEVDGTVIDANTQAALQAISTWADLDWDEAVEDLDRIGRQTEPSPPLDL
jgi:hypothetical protein